ncbi:hypothetical protein FRC16_003458, partial [Serendipita sp. 398]
RDDPRNLLCLSIPTSTPSTNSQFVNEPIVSDALARIARALPPPLIWEGPIELEKESVPLELEHPPL